MKRFLSVFLFAILFGGSAMAYDFSAVCSSGQTLYYNISDMYPMEPYTVEVVSENDGFYTTEPTGDLVIPESVEYNSITYPVTGIGTSAFMNCTGLTSVTIPNSVTYIGMLAFQNCSELTSVTIGNSVASIANSAFSMCIGLTNITIPSSVTSIEELAFSSCSRLEFIVVESGNSTYDSRENCNAIIETATNKLVLGCANTIILNSVTGIGNYAFQGIIGLTSISIPNSVTSIGNSAFQSCHNMTEITIPNSVPEIGMNAFSGCSGLTEITIPNSVTSIGVSAFSNCNGLTSVTIGSSVTEIGDLAFSDCWNISVINISANTPPNLGDDVFTSTIYSTATLNVPNGSIDVYENANGWSNFQNIRQNSATGGNVSWVTIGSDDSFIGELPVNGEYNYSLSQQIYTNAEIDRTGTITKIALYNGNPQMTRTINLYMVSTYKQNFSDLDDWESVSSSNLVFSGEVTFLVSEWTEIELNTPFEYDGTGNIIVVVDDNTGNYESAMNFSAFEATGQSIYVYSDYTDYDATDLSAVTASSIGSVKNQIKFGFMDSSSQTSGDSVNWITIGAGNSTNQNLPVNSYYDYSFSQQIYSYAEIGRAGTIESVAFYNTSYETTRTIDLYMYNTDRQTFTSTIDWEFVDPGDLVFSGEVTFLSDEWTEIPLNTPFEYDGLHNIIIVADDNTVIEATSLSFRVFSATSQAIYYSDYSTDIDPTYLNGTTALDVANVKSQIKFGFTATNPTFSYVDLGLTSGTLWATMNVGAERPEDFGTYFAWGETSTKTIYDWASYTYAAGEADDAPGFTKYCNDASLGNSGFTDELTVLQASDDAATAILGENWRMPTYDEILELTSECQYSYTTQNGVYGIIVTGPNSNTIFIPAAGGRQFENEVWEEGSGSYWASSLDTNSPTDAQGFYFESNGFGPISIMRRYGLPIRPVYVPSNTANNQNGNVIFQCDFEDDTEIANWTLNTGGQINHWEIGIPSMTNAEKSLYITNGNGNEYTNTSASYAYAYREIEITEAGNYQFEFDWMANGESNYDNLRAFFIPTTASPNLTDGESNGMTSSNNDAPTGWIDLYSQSGIMAGQSDWQHNTKSLSIDVTGTYYLVFFWKNDSGDGNNPPAAVDNIVVSREQQTNANTFTDIRDGKTYSYVTIGNQTWMAENLRYEGNIPLGSSTSTTEAYRYNPNDDADNVATYGYLYNWTAAMNGESSSASTPSGVQGICPNGWHLPSIDEWLELADALDGGTDKGSQLAGRSDLWTAQALTNSTYFGASGFDALPAGYYGGAYQGIGRNTYFWCATESALNNSSAFYQGISYDYTTLSNSNGQAYSGKDYAYSVRCVKDAVNTASYQTGSFTDTRDGRSYDYVVIGEQTWMAENLRYDNSGSMTVALSNEQSETDPYLYYPNGDSQNLETYGYLYNWPAAMNGAESSDANPSGVQGICPDGWHLPSNAEWTQLVETLGDEANAGAMLAGNASIWTAGTLTASEYFGTSGFNALPSGYYYPGDYGGFGSTTSFWSTTEDIESNTRVYLRGVDNSGTSLSRSRGSKTYGFSVRCVKDAGTVADGPSDPTGTHNNHGYIDLGLPSGTMWATTNIGANTPSDYGKYYSWGEVTFPGSYESYDWSEYDLCDNGSSATLNKYCTNGDYGTVDNLTTLSISDDAASDNWGGEWRMPTSTEFQELITNCTWEWSIQDGMEGYLVSGNGNSIFLPAAGYMDATGEHSIGTDGNYWTSSLREDVPIYAMSILFYSGGTQELFSQHERPEGLTIRPVYTPSNTASNQTGSFTDTRDGRTYSYVIIGDQTWMAENLRYDNSGSMAVALSGETSTTDPYLYYPNGESGNLETYGYLYNWPAAMNGESSSESNPSGVQGICPDGWHLPSNAEWTQLYQALGGETNAGAMLSGNVSLWSNPTITESQYFGNSGFNALPAGYYESNDYGNFGNKAFFWSTSEYDTESAYICYIGGEEVGNMGYGESAGLSVRCVKDASNTANNNTNSDDIIYQSDFENSGEWNEWTLNNGDQTNKWTIGLGNGDASSTETNSLYITNDNSSYNYNNGAASAVYAYKEIELSSTSNYHILFDWKCIGEESWDYLRAFIIPASENPNLSAGNVIGDGYEDANTTPDGWIDLYDGEMSGSDNQWRNAESTVALSAGNYYLVFYWRNDESAGSNPPAAVDNIFIYKLMPISVTTNVSDRTSTSVTLNGIITFVGEPENIAAGFKWGNSETSLPNNITTQSTGATFSEQLTGLTQQTTYYYQAYAVYDGDTAFSEIAEFRTALDESSAGGANNPLLIGDMNDWQDFSNALQNPSTVTYKGVMLADYGLDMYFSLESDLSFTEAGVAFSIDNFKGNLNGNYNTITIQPDQTFTGLFANFSDGHIDNLNLRMNSSATLEGAGDFGVLCQNAYQAYISNCTVSGISSEELSSSDDGHHIGGLVGYAMQTTISGCTNNLKIVSGGAKVGGIVGKADGTIMYCINNAELSGAYVGGIMAEGAATITNCLNTGLINCAEEYAGGISGTGGTIVGCMNIGEISATGTQKAGGIIGNAESTTTVTNCANYGVFPTFSSPMGGIAGSGSGTYSHNVSAPLCRSTEQAIYSLNEIYATVATEESDYTSAAETDDFFDEQVGDIKVDSLRLRFAERGTHKTTTEIVGSALSGSLSSEYWDFTEDLYPKPQYINETSQTIVARIPIYLGPHQSVFGVWENFSLPTSVDGHQITWASNDNAISISDGTATVTRPASGEDDIDVQITADYDGYTKTFVVRVIAPKQIPVMTADAWQDSVIYMRGEFSNQLDGITYAYDYGFQYSTTSADLSEGVTSVQSTNLNHVFYDGRTFSYPLAGIPNGTMVYYRAYATTADGTEYGEIKSHKALGAPVVVAKYPMWRTDTDASIEPDITLNEGEIGSFYQMERNVHYGTERNNLNLTESISYDADYSEFSIYFSDLTPNTKYYYAFDVTNDYGTGRSDTLEFITCGTMTDSRDNTQYYTIQIGNQTWMAQNLKFDGVTAGTDTSSFVAYRYNPDDFDGYVEDYGYLYNWTAILNGGNSSTENPSGVQGICPNGWHLPSDAEWTQLTTYLGGGDEVAAMLSGHPASEGQYWEITDMTESVNFGKSGFNAMPTGVYYAGYYEFGKQTAFWSVTESDDIHIYSRYIMGYGEGSISRDENEGPNGYAVRCVKGTAVYAYDTINQCMEQPYSYTYHDTVITTDGDYTIREQIDSDTENIYKLHIAFHPTLTATVSEFSNGCFGANNGYVEVGATGGAGDYSYVWSTPEMQTTARISNLTDGEYTVTVTDVGGCTASVSQTIVTPGQLTVTISGDNQICEGDNASLTATAEGGTPDYSYAWTNGATNESTNVQTAGTYAVTVTDDASCTATAAIVVTVNPAATLELTSGQQNQTLCYGTNFTTTVFTYGGGANGVDVTGLPNGVSFTTDATNHTVEISGTPTEAGSYTYMVTTTGVTSPCTNITITGTIIVQMQLTATINGNNPDCYGDETTLTASLAEGTPNTYAWSSGETSASITVSPTTTTTYTVTITDANGCTVTASKNVVVNSQLTVSISGDTQVQCFGDNTATLTASASGGSMATGYTYNWSNSLEGQTISSLGAGNYNVTVTDANGCVATASVTITQPSAALSVSISATNTTLTCSNLSSTITATVTGGTEDYTYTWSNSGSNNTTEVTTPGSYMVEVADANGCTAEATQAITQDITQPTVTIDNDETELNCNQTSIALTATGSGASYVWSNGETNAATTVTTPDTYTVTATGSNGCTTEASVVITKVENPTVEVTASEILCNGATTTFTANVSNGKTPYNYRWQDNSSNQTLTAQAGTYNVTITDSNGCTASASGTANQPSQLTASISKTDVLCNGASNGTATVTVDGGNAPYQYNWSNGGSDLEITGLTTGNYSVTVSDSNGCSTTLETTIDQPNTLTATISGNNPDCYGDETTLTTSADGGTPNYTYAWNTNQTTESIAVTPTETTTYTITITDANGCTASASKNVVVNSQLTVSISGDTQVQCFGDNTATLTASASGGSMAMGYTYNWSNSLEGQTISSLGAGNYNVTVTDANGCVATASVTITQPSVALSVSISATNTTLTCSNLSSTLTATPTGGTEDYTYSWSNSGSNNTTEVTNPGSYIVEVTDANGCTAEATQAITQDITAPTVTIDNTETELNCNRTSIALTATGNGASYVWSNGETNATTTVTTPDTYTVTATGSNGCTNETSIAITKVENPTVEVTAGEILCNGATTTFTANVSNGKSPYSYRWQDNSTSQTLNAQAGTYSVTITDNNGCTASASTTVNVNDQTVPELTGTWPSNITGQNNCFANADISELLSNDAVEALYEDCSGLTVSHSDANTSTDDAGWTVTRTYTIQDIYGNAVTPNPTMSVSGSDQSAPELSGTWPANITGQNNCFANADISGFMDDDDVVALYSDCGTVTVSHSDANTTTDNCGWTITRTFTISDGINSVTNTQSVSGSDQSVPTLTGTWPDNITGQNNCFANADLSGLISDDDVAAQYSDACGGTVTVSHVDANTATDNCGWTITRTYTITNTCGTNSTTMTQSVSGSDQTAPVLSGTWSANITAQNNCFADADISGLMGDDDVAELYSDGCGGTISVTHTDANTTTDNCGWTITRTYTISDVCGNEVTNTQSVSGSDQTAPTIGDDNLNRQLTSTNCTFIVPDLTSEVRNIASDNCTANGNLTISQNITAGTEITATTTVTVTVTDQCGNNSTKDIELTLPAVLTTSLSADPATIACNGNTTDITNTPSGGTTPYQYFWSNSTNEQNLEDVSADRYTVTVRDNNGCSVVESIEITQPNALTASLSATEIPCHGVTSTITNTVAGGTTPYAYAWESGETSQNLTGVSGGTYKVTVTDANGCTASATITVNEPEQLTSSLSAGEIRCNGGTTDITNTVSGGTTPIIYEWNNGANTQNLTGVVAGTYRVTVRDNNSCSVVREITITQPNVLAVSVNAGSVACNGSTTTASAVVSGGTEPYEYQWSNSATTQTITDIIAGTYSVTVTDDNGCSTNAFTTITQPEELTVSISGPTSVCEGTTSTLTANVQGGTADFTYSWSNSATTSSITTPQLTTATEYSVTVTDANNCSASASVNVEIGDTPGITIADVTPICAGGNTMLQANVSNAGTGYTVEWSSTDTGAGLPADITTDAITVAPTSAGTYTYTVSLTATSCSDGEPFTSSDNVTLTVNSLPNAAITNNTNETTITCSTTEISLTATGGNTYAWSNGVANAENNITSAGNYTVTVTDANGCSNTESIVITEDVAAPTVNIINETGTTLLTCTTTTINVEATGTGTSYLWSNEVSGTNNSFTADGTYTVTATADNGCTSTAAIQITPNTDAPTVSITNNTGETELTCARTSISVTATGSGTSYQWSGGATTDEASNTFTEPGTYTVVATAGNDCSASAQITITQNIEAPEIIASAAATAICQGGSTTISATGGQSYTWSPETELQTTVGSSITVTPTETRTYTVTGVGTNGCTGTAEVTITVNQPTSSEFTATACNLYTWNGTNYTESGDFQQTLVNANGCDSVVTLHLTINNAVSNEFSETACSSFEWNSTTYTETGDYVQTLQTVNDCDSVVTLHLTINTPTESNDTVTVCDSYEWNGTTYTETGNYQVTLPNANANGCDSIANLFLTINHTVTGIDRQEACESFTWIDGNTYTESTDSTDAPTFTLQNAEGCDSVVSLYLVVNYSTTSEVSAQMCSGVPYTYEGETFTEAGTYTVTLTNSHGCDSIVTLTITYANNCGGIVSGVVTDENSGEPIYNARVTVGNKVTRTNAEGEYSIEVLRGRKTFRVSAAGYISYSNMVDIQSDTAFNISLNAPHIETDVDSLAVSSYPYLEQSDSITLSNTGSGTLIWSSITEYDNLALVEDSIIQQRSNTRSLWDSIQTFTTRENAEQAIATDGFFIYTSSWMRPGEFNRYTPNGEYVETFYVENVGSIRNLSYDGTHFYGTEGTNIIFKLDLDNQTLVDSIETDIPEIRHCSFNRQDGSLLAGSWNSLYRIDIENGTYEQIRSDLANVYSSAFDNLSPGGPYLWLFSQTSQNNGPSAYIRQFNISTGEYTSKTHYLDDINLTNSSLAGGICASEYICEGKFVLLADVQNPMGSNTIATYEIGRTNNVVKTGKKSGSLAPNSSENISVKASATETGDYSATIRYRAAVMGAYSRDIDVNISAVAPECDAVQQISIVTDTFHTVTLDWQPVELGNYESVSYLVFNTASQYAIDTVSETTVTYDGLPVGEHCFCVMALSQAGYTCLSAASDTVCAEIEDIPCNIPLAVEARSDGESITVSWNMPVGVDYVSLYRYSDPIDEHLTTTSYIDTNVVPETDYCYIVIAHFENGICNEITGNACIRIAADVCTEAPVLTADAVNGTVALEWTESNGAVNYRVFRNDTFVGATNGTTYIDNVSESGEYCYRVESICEYGMFASSDEVCLSIEVVEDDGSGSGEGSGEEEGDAIDEWTADNLTLYPNPTYGQFFIEGQRIAVVQIFNASGMLVTEIENTEDERITINCEGWNPGLYNIRIISTEGETATRKVTIFR